MTFHSPWHPMLVVLHWLAAILMAGVLYLGCVKLSDPGLRPETIPVLQAHMAGGMLLLALMLVRLIVRLRTARTRATPALRQRPIHIALYALVLATIVIGYANAVSAGLPEIVFGGSGQPMPANFHDRVASVLHRWLAWTLALLVAWHALAAVLPRVVARRSNVFRFKPTME